VDERTSSYSFLTDKQLLFAPVEAVDAADPPTYSERVKHRPRRKKIATPQDVVRLAKKAKWTDIALPDGEIVAAGTIREMFALAEAGLKRSKRRKRLEAAAD